MSDYTVYDSDQELRENLSDVQELLEDFRHTQLALEEQRSMLAEQMQATIAIMEKRVSDYEQQRVSWTNGKPISLSSVNRLKKHATACSSSWMPSLAKRTQVRTLPWKPMISSRRRRPRDWSLKQTLKRSNSSFPNRHSISPWIRPA